MQAKLNKSQDDLEKATESTRELDLSRSVAVLALMTVEGEKDQLKALVERFEAVLARAHKEALQEYRANFKETQEYLCVLNF